jgi:hypothetical protein
MKQLLDNLDQISRDSAVTATEMPMTARSILASLISALCAYVLTTPQRDSYSLISKAWDESRLTPELIMFRYTWL